MRHVPAPVASLLCVNLAAPSLAATPQAPDKELVAAISGPTLAGGVVTGLAWDGGTLVIQTVGVEKTAPVAEVPNRSRPRCSPPAHRRPVRQRG